MVNKYIKAILLTAILFLFGSFLISVFDNERINQISITIEENSLDMDSTQQLLLYESITGDSEGVCEVLPKQIDMQIEKTRNVLGKLEAAKAQSLFAEIELPKMKYINQNIQLYLLMEKSIRDCGNKEVAPLLYFYTDKSYFPDEDSQAKVLDSLVERCSNIRVFAFPHDLDIPVVEVLLKKYEISSFPAMVIENQTIQGLTSEEAIREKLSGCIE